jgi:hypothetical protein
VVGLGELDQEPCSDADAAAIAFVADAVTPDANELVGSTLVDSKSAKEGLLDDVLLTDWELFGNCRPARLYAPL